MARSGAALVVFLVVSVNALKFQSIDPAHPVVDVISLLQGLEKQVESEGKAEALTYEKFAYWCKNSKKELEKTIAQEKATIEILSDEIESLEKNIEVLTGEIADLDAEKIKLDQEELVAANARSATASVHQEEAASLNATIVAIEQALATLVSTRSSTDSGLLQSRQQVAAILALVSNVSPQQQSLLQQYAEPERPTLEAAGDYGAHIKNYSFKSSSVIELLKKLKIRFTGELRATEKAETNSFNAAALATEARNDLLAAIAASRTTKTGELGVSTTNRDTAEGTKASTEGDLTADSGSLKETTQACRIKASEWAERSETRESEIAAIRSAVEILAKVTGVRTQAPSNPVPPTSPVSFLQIFNPNTKRAVQLLREEARLTHSRSLDELVERVSAHSEGPFDDVVNMIQKLIFHLMNEQKEEDDHKNWCDLELNKTDASINDKAERIVALGLEIEQATLRAANLAQKVQEANDKVADINKHTAEATAVRKIGKEENALAVKDAESAQTAITNAISVLSQFYKDSGRVPKESWEFLQRARAPVQLPANPSTWSAEYTGVADPVNQPDGIITVLEQVSADFAQMESQTHAQEESDQNIYEEDMSSCKIEKARLTKESEEAGLERKRTLDRQSTLEKFRKTKEGEKEAAEQYMRDLQPACVEGSSTYENRKANRTKEIDALHDAQGLLQNAFNSTNSTPPAAPTFFLRGRSV